ncbi:hypothetical protein K443DRAFT_6196 [Laccaria amethystina LaAM-08-1]|uniref:Unplaced genomic scaffold K443scaffold_58, whole genome shotgun sequence n=1 Tax=Laccaria amethystina LaAM-08-1 TaxID=1095629 RepID=A0A0C9XXR2_9AGAR|nr:hypothetical protein K443DRAFT_6196 [Laccaria amethystina LaAM-08-1]
MVLQWNTDIFRRLLLPTTSKEYVESQASRLFSAITPSLISRKEEYDKKFKDVLEEKRTYLKTIEGILKKATLAKHRTLEQQTQDDTAQISALRDNIRKCNVLSAHIEEVKKNIEGHENLLNCQTTLDMTGFYELRDWAKVMSSVYYRVATGLITISLAGAGIVYATIFNAVRGNIGLMVFSFSLFSVGFVVPTLIQFGLSWAQSSSSRVPFASQTSWRIVIGAFMALSFLAVGSAIIILNITVFDLGKNTDVLTDSIPRSASIAIFAFSGLLVLIFLLSMILSVIARGPEKFFLGETRTTKQKKGQQLEDFDLDKGTWSRYHRDDNVTTQNA